MFTLLLAWIFLGTAVLATTNSTQKERQYLLDNYFSIQNKLVKDLFADYQRQVPALYLSERNNLPAKPLRVNASLMYTKVLEIDQAKQSASMIIDFTYEWTDPRLVWNASDYSGIEGIALSMKETVWIPDALPYDTLSYADTLPEDQQYLSVDKNGRVSFYKTAVIDFICRMNLHDFPFDIQICDLQLSSLNFPESEMPIWGIVGPNTAKPETLVSAGNGEWAILNITVENTVVVSGFGSPYSNPIFKFTMKRSTVYYVVLMIVPSFILTILCVIGLFWEEVHGQRYMENLNLGFAAILAMMFVLQMATQDMPKINETDRLSIYLIVNLGIITLCSILVMIIGKSKMNRFREKKGESRLDKCLAFIVRRLHLILMVMFCIASAVNFVKLVS